MSEENGLPPFSVANWLTIIGLIVTAMFAYSSLAAENRENRSQLTSQQAQINTLSADNKRMLELLTDLRADVRYLRQTADKQQQQ